MTLAAIVAHDPNLVIGHNGSLPWHYSEDLKYFKRTTMGHPMIMGRVVFEDLNEEPLPGRKNVVLSRTREYDHVPTFSSISDALNYVEDEDLVFVIGGEKVYQQLFFQIDKLFVTEIHKLFKGDTHFPEYRDDIGTIWKEVKREDKGELSFVVYERMN